MTSGLSQTACDSARFVGFLTASSAGLLDWSSMISFSPRLPERQIQQGGAWPSPQLSLDPANFVSRRAFFPKDLLTEISSLKTCSALKTLPVKLKRKDIMHIKRDFVKGSKNAKCQIREPLHRRGKIRAGTHNRGREKRGWCTWQGSMWTEMSRLGWTLKSPISSGRPVCCMCGRVSHTRW